jgi:GNAT superfamily N-acetyltransferase
LETDAMREDPGGQRADAGPDERVGAVPCLSTLRGVAARIRDARHAVGIAGLVGSAPAWLVRREYLATVKDLTDPVPRVPAIPGIAWRLLERAEVPLLVASSPRLSGADVWRRLGEGQECWVAWLDNAAVHWRWETRRDAYLPYLQRHARPLTGDLWVVEVYTQPSHRGRGLYVAGTLMAMQRARDRGDLRLIGLIAGWNRTARRVAEEKLQRTVVGTVGYWGSGRWRCHFATGEIALDGDGRVFIPQRSRPASQMLVGTTI